ADMIRPKEGGGGIVTPPLGILCPKIFREVWVDLEIWGLVGAQFWGRNGRPNLEEDVSQKRQRIKIL
ncbi:hypothetical protein, partial [Bacteroides uniformis]|uniref:hypothetical protein n=1 Tax=Bacteroides uniformis TaxID=820 RepID=UPI001AA1A1E2